MFGKIGPMPATQPDLFGAATPEPRPPSDEHVAYVRKRLTDLVTLVKGADTMPWPNLMDAIQADNTFRFNKHVLPQAEWEALWAVFDVELDRLYAIMNEGKEMPDD
jgi:hypothetical protein